MMYVHGVNYLKERGESERGTLLNRGFWLSGTPRLMPICRLRGHKPVVDGTEPTRPGNLGSRWMCCDRCGTRPDPQGNLDPYTWDIGQVYTGPRAAGLPEDSQARWDKLRSLKDQYYPPGPWREQPTGEIGGQLVVGRTFGGVGMEFKVGCAGSDHTLEASVHLHHLGALYLHATSHGTWLQRRLIPTGYDSRVVELSISDSRLRWRLWAKRHEWSRDTPKWQDGSVCVDPREWLWGPTRNNFEDVGSPQRATVRLPHGDDHEVTLQLRRCTTGRTRGRKTHSWWADWKCEQGIPCRDDDWKGDSVYGAGVEVGDQAVNDGTWPMAAAAAIAAQLTRHRCRHNYSPPATTAASG
jgi:hypothetical protein